MESQALLFVVRLALLLVQVATLSLLAQGIIGLLAGRAREQNFVYRLFKTVTDPAVKAVRLITPRAILDRHLPFLAFFLLVWLWLGLTVAKCYVCIYGGLECERGCALLLALLGFSPPP